MEAPYIKDRTLDFWPAGSWLLCQVTVRPSSVTDGSVGTRLEGNLVLKSSDLHPIK